MKPGADLTGGTFGRWTVIGRAENRGPLTAWTCVCACGVKRDVLRQSLVEGRSKSCGCYNLEAIQRRNHKHGHAHAGQESLMYQRWRSMRCRCFDPKAKGYRYYGGRGITVCDRWRDSFLAFLEDMGECPPDHSLDRINPDGNYEPGNCRWATCADQTANRRAFVQAGRRGEESNFATLTWPQIEEIRAAAGTASQRELARRYGVSQGNISMIQAKRTWIGDEIAAVGAAKDQWGQGDER